MSDTPEEKKTPLREITQPFIDLVHAPRALWGINLSYVIEGMVYFGMLVYLAIHFSDFVFQGVDAADVHSHHMVGVLTAGITLAMVFLGFMADKYGVRKALILAFVLMLVGRTFMAGAPNVMGLEPTRPGVFAGDKVSLHITEIDTKDKIKTITKATVTANDEEAADVEANLSLDLAAGEGIAPGEALESRLVQLEEARLVKGEDPEWKVRYGSKPVTARLLIHSGEELRLFPGATISLERAYITSSKKKKEEQKEEGKEESRAEGNEQEREEGTGAGEDDDEAEQYEYIIRSHWLSDVKAVNTFPLDLADGDGIAPEGTLESWRVQLSAATVVEGAGKEWRVRYGQKPVIARLLVDSAEQPPLCAGAVISVNRAQVIKQDKEADEFIIQVEWPEGFAAVDGSGCTNPDEIAKAVTDQLLPDLAVAEGTPPDEKLTFGPVQLGKAKLVKREGQEWQVQYGRAPVIARLLIDSRQDAALSAGALISLRRADVLRPNEDRAGFIIRARWPRDFAAVNTYGCEESPYRAWVTADEKALKADSRPAVAEEAQAVRDAAPVTIAALRDMKDGSVNVVLRDVYVTYVRNGGYFLQSEKDGPAIFAFVDPVCSPLHLVTMLGILFVIVGYGMYQPAAYAGVRQFTTPKTATMGFAMLYALMNLGAWLPTFAFLLRDEDYLDLGIPGTYWVYAGFTLIALLCTFFILSKRTVQRAIARAKEETARIKEAEAAQKGQKEVEAEQRKFEEPPAAEPETLRRKGVPLHLWGMVVALAVAFYLTLSAPWWYILSGALVLAALIVKVLPAATRWVARHPLADGKFFFFIFALIPVQTLFTYNWFVLPQYISRAYVGWMGDYYEIFSNANPLLIFILAPIIAAATQKRKVYNMMIAGTFVMAAPAFLLVIGPSFWTLAGYIVFMTVGEAMWQPRFLQYAAEIAPEGRTGVYMGVAQLPWFLTKVLVPLLYSGTMMAHYCPAEGAKDTETMWLICGCIAISSTVLLLLAKRWVGKDFKTKHEG